MSVPAADSFVSQSSVEKKGEIDVRIEHAQGNAAKDWTDEEETRVRRKIDVILLPIMGLAFFALQMDRGNISTALTSSITTDLGISTDQINVGTQLLSAGIVVLELPSNIVLQKVGPHYWLSAQVVLWSLVATFQTFISNYAGYLTTRLLLGLLEAGFIPGGLYYLSTWYKTSEASTRTTMFFFGNLLAAATSALIGAGLLSLDGVGGLPGWRWLFLIEGLIGLTIGVVFFLFLPTAVGDGSPFISFKKWSYFTPRETYIMQQRVVIDDPLKVHSKVSITGADIWATLKQKRIWLHFFITLASQTGTLGLNTYAPRIIQGLGVSTTKANELASAPLFGSVVFTFALSYISDWTGFRGYAAQFSITWTLISQICLRTLNDELTGMHKYAVIFITQLAYSTLHILNVGWLTVNAKSPQERSISLALVVMAANCGGITSAQVFRADDAPLYNRALTAEVSCVAAAWGLVLIQNGQYFFNRRRFPRNNRGKQSLWREQAEMVAESGRDEA